MTWVFNLFWQIVFWWKKRTGWLDLNEVIEVTGTIANLVPPDPDGDHCFNVYLDPGFEKYITGFGGRLTMEDDAIGPAIHCEISPWTPTALRETYAKLKPGDRVRVKGRWGFDGVHLGRATWIEIPAALVRHQPNIRDGWFEIHPVAELEIL